MFARAFTTLSRGIFELHLILLEATSNETSFFKIQFKIGNTYEDFIKLFYNLSKRRNNHEASKTLKKELDRIRINNNKWSQFWGLKNLTQYSKYFNFKNIAKKYNLLDNYNIEYRILSSFVHPTDLYLITLSPLPRTTGSELAEWNVRNRIIMIKKMALKFALGYSEKNKERIQDLMKITDS